MPHNVYSLILYILHLWKCFYVNPSKKQQQQQKNPDGKHYFLLFHLDTATKSSVYYNHCAKCEYFKYFLINFYGENCVLLNNLL